MRIAIDFDGTITKKDVCPKDGEIADNCIEVIKYLYESGHKLILNTCRIKEDLQNALIFLDSHDILKYFYKINENCPEDIKYYNADCRKISADVYIDDKNLGGFPGWLRVKEEVDKKCQKN
jgi:hypothetical protein